MAAATEDLGNQLCTLCKEDDVNNPALTCCTDCETFLCPECEKHHGRNKASKKHYTVSVNDFKELPLFITSTSPRCKEHGKRFELYCSFHQEACCLECITVIHSRHDKCNEIRELADILKDFKASSHVAHTEDDLRDIQNNFDKITKYLKSRLRDIDAQKTKGVKQIKDMRRSINDHLDKLEQKLLDNLDDKHIKIKISIENLLKDIKNRKSQTDQLENDFNKMKKFATELQTFIGLKEIERMTTEMVDYLTASHKKDYVQKNNLEIEMSSKILDVETLGNVIVSSVPVSLQLTKRKDLQARLQIQDPVKIGQIKPKLLKKISLGNVRISGCQILLNGQTLFLDQTGKRLIMFNEDGSFVRVVVTFTEVPYDVTFIKDNTVAVTMYTDTKVHFVDFDRNTILKSTNMSKSGHGIDSDSNVMVINCGCNKCIISLDIENTSELSSIILQSYSKDIATFGENIYINEYNDHRVKCLSKNGDVLWTYKLTEGKHPRGLSVDKHGFVYVTCRDSNSVAVISPEGNEGCTILTKDDGMLSPIALNFNRNTSKLLVANKDNGEAFLYQM